MTRPGNLDSPPYHCRRLALARSSFTEPWSLLASAQVAQIARQPAVREGELRVNDATGAEPDAMDGSLEFLVRDAGRAITARSVFL